jgi:hypothetical protein
MKMPFGRIALAILLVGGCGGVRQSLRALTELQSGLAAQFGGQVDVNLHNQTILAVTFVNSAREELPPPARVSFADSVAAFVRSHYPTVDSLRRIDIGFVRAAGGGPITVTRTDILYSYGPGQPHPAPGTAN